MREFLISIVLVCSLVLFFKMFYFVLGEDDE